MSSSKSGWRQVQTGIFLLVAAIILGESLVAAIINNNGQNALGKISVTVKNQLDPEQQNHFSLEELNRIEQLTAGVPLTYIAQTPDPSAVTFNHRDYPVNVMGVNSQYPRYCRLRLKQGAFWTLAAERNQEPVMVIDEELAWQVFKSEQVVGQTLFLFGHPFKIIGVLAKDESLINQLIQTGYATLYLPAGALLALNRQARIMTWQWATPDTSTLDQNKILAANILREIGKNPDHYIIIDYNIRRTLLEQLPRLLVYILSILLGWMMLKHWFQLIQAFWRQMKAACRSEYLAKAFRNQLSVFYELVIQTLLIWGGVACLLWLSQIQLYIPPRLLPDELIDTAYYRNLIHTEIQTHTANLGYIPSRPEQALHMAEILVSGLFVSGLLGGLFLVANGFFRLGIASVKLEKIFMGTGGGLLGAMAGSVLIACLMRIPPVITLKNMIILWGFIFGKALFDREEEAGPKWRRQALMGSNKI